ncbi:MAG: bifunctional biotin--[acetyl-CoA-carboxylase] ligase/biotin operon repressor BirA [Gammaproteobacteria bacterium]|nr:bifunctional biotin--[acetyl-CoA-carboxylase] ligase/biotin operon repressor BirA [Gammaproteobacteria bacterium]MBU1655419.1 bifunctional biotin--[acetyl-CoA-carboxylase] ligase/biotin operon repressor BirA [Gammaproteobacteria bacterium]MBU1962164.1 bifunctional biotin--[acetyl-CoA-carboxylase] ligase/biotin operon repressor BirA [Gammaproteobacteria bacterium]
MVAPLLIQALADGRFHSGEELAGRMGVSRTAVWKQIQGMGRTWGLKVLAVKGKGYRLAQPLDLLQEAEILRWISPEMQRRIQRLEIHTLIDSTNRYLMGKASSALQGAHVCLAEQQTQGQGRRGRPWFSPFAGNIYLSLLWRSSRPPHRLGGLSLALGVAVAGMLREMGFSAVGLKWPNDLVSEEGKLGGILIQMIGEGEGPSTLVAGLGLNVRMPPEAGQNIDQPWVDLVSLGSPPKRSHLAGMLIDVLVDALIQYETKGLEPFLSPWRRLDQYHDRQVVLLRGEERIHGRCAGIAEDGALLLDTDSGRERFHGGEISLRAD